MKCRKAQFVEERLAEYFLGGRTALKSRLLCPCGTNRPPRASDRNTLHEIAQIWRSTPRTLLNPPNAAPRVVRVLRPEGGSSGG